MKLFHFFLCFCIFISWSLFAQEPTPIINVVSEALPDPSEIGLIAKILMYVVAMNIFLVGLAGALHKIKDATKADVDNKLYDILSKITGFLAKIIDLASANTKLKK